MAAQPQPSVGELVDLRSLAPGRLDALLEEETKVWQQRLNWDFSGSAELIRRFANMGSLNGRALLCGGTVAGYAYFVAEEGKGLIGDIYVLKKFSTPDMENRILTSSAEELIRNWNCNRVECQLLLLDAQRRNAPAFGKHPAFFDRNFMVLPQNGFQLQPRQFPALCVIEPFNDRLDIHNEAARLVTESYSGHIDALINDQYRSIPGARRFLRNIIQYPGCGTFNYAASFIARESDSNRLLGLSFASNVSAEAGHITQLCVTPRFRSTGLGYELMRRSIDALGQAGARQVSLTVTTKNKVAVNFYERLGFRTENCFSAIVWEKKPGLVRSFFQ